MKINTSFVNPPIGDRSCDWQATLDNYEEGGLIGRGATETEAIEDLKEQLGDEPTSCPACGAEDYHCYQVGIGNGDPSHTWCECHHCETSFYGATP